MLGDFLTGDRAGWEAGEGVFHGILIGGQDGYVVGRIIAPRDTHILALGPVSVEPDMAMTLQMGVG